MGKATDAILAVLLAVVGVATAAVIFSKKADTANVINAGGSAFANIIKAAVAPVAT